MGNTQIKRRVTKIEKLQAVQDRKQATLQIKQKIQHLENDIINQTRSNQTQMTNKNFVQAIMIAETAKHQLNRESENLVKDDLIAIIIALNGDYSQQIDYLKSFTVKDLNSLIRVIIYDPTRYMSCSSKPEEKKQHFTQNFRPRIEDQPMNVVPSIFSIVNA